MGKIEELVPTLERDEGYADRRRECPRFPFHEDVELEGEGSIKGITLDVSSGGVRAALESIVMIGERCPLVVRTDPTSIYRQEAEVVWTRPVGEHFIAGFQFV